MIMKLNFNDNVRTEVDDDVEATGMETRGDRLETFVEWEESREFPQHMMHVSFSCTCVWLPKIVVSYICLC